MKRAFIILSFLIGLIFISNLISMSFNNNHFNKSNNHALKASQVDFIGGALNIPLGISFLEESENLEQQNNTSNIAINLSTARWNVTNIQFNITKMSFKNETKIIEDKDNIADIVSSSSYDYLNLGVQIELLAPTIIYGIYIFAENLTTSPTYKETFLQIQGNNKNTNKPNGTRLISVPLNITRSKGLSWHMHMFPSPLPLNKGIYYLVLNGTNIGTTPKIIFHWWYCYNNPNYPHLNISKSKTTWGDPAYGCPYLYKIIQKVNKNFYPKQINMTATINGTIYKINDGNDISTGNLNVPFKNFSPKNSNLNISIKNNISNALIFNVNSYVKLNNSLISKGNVLIREEFKNFWTIEPEFNRFGKIYTIKFKFSNNWEILNVFNNTEELILGQHYFIISNTLLIFNKTILSNTNYLKITANSTNFNSTLVLDVTDYRVGDNFGIRVQSPAKLGNYTFILVDSIGENVFTDYKIKTDPNYFYFNYTFPSYSRNGNWISYVFWNNFTDAGVSVATFQVEGGTSPVILPSSDSGGGNGDGGSTTIIEGITPIIFTVVIVAIIIGFSGAISFYIGIKEVRRRRELQKERIYNQFMDVYNLSYIMISHRKSGLNVFEQSFAGANMNPTLITGYLNALNMFGIEITGSLEQSQSIKLEYQNLIILMSDFKNLRTIVILKENPSKNLLKTISRLSYEINDLYGDQLEKFDGVRINFEKIGELIEKHMQLSLISPLQMKKIDLTFLNQTETAIIQKAKHIVKRNNFSFFFTSYLMPGQQYDYNYAKAILDLIEKGILIPIKVEITI